MCESSGQDIGAVREMESCKSRFVSLITVTLCVLPLLHVRASATQEASRIAIEGVVLDGKGEGVSGAEVRVTSAPPEALRPGSFLAGVSRSVATNARGRFSISDVPIGSYRISVRASGFAPHEYGQRSSASSGMRVSFTGRTLNDLVIHLTPLSVVFGTLLGESREPVIDVQVALLRQAMTTRGPGLQAVAVTATDDRGQYRLISIPPGRYYLGALSKVPQGKDNAGSFLVKTAATSTLPLYPLQFFPGLSDLNQAVPVEVSPATELRFDMNLRRRQQTYKIQGTVIDTVSGMPLAGESISLSLIPSSLVAGINNFFDTVGSYDSLSGRFELFAPPGSYVIQAQNRVFDETARGVGEAAWSMLPTGRTAISVLDRDVENVRLSVKRPSIVSGQVGAQGEAVPNMGMHLSLIPTSRSPEAWEPPGSDVAANGTFRFIGMIDGEYFVRAQGVPKGFSVKSIQYHGEDILDQPWRFSNPTSGNLEVVLARETAEVSGVVTNVRVEPISVSVVLIPELRSRTDLYRVSTTDQHGQFAFADVAFGNYRIFAWEGLEAGAYWDPNFLRRFEDRGKLVKILDGSSQRLDVLAISAP
jgi:hypothetical protein